MILELNNVAKAFGGLHAVQNVTFGLNEGEILGLIGPNGAGKTTLFNLISGVYPLTRGTIVFRGQTLSGLPSYRVAHQGIARTHQVTRPLGELTVRENVIVGACYGQKHYGLRRAAQVATEVMEFVGLTDRADQLARSLNVAQKKRLELARALASEPHLLLLDEVLAGLNVSEVTTMVETIRRIRERGVSIIMIEHIMHAVMNVSDRIIVLNYGKLIAAGTPVEVVENPVVIEAYLGSPEQAEHLPKDV